MKKKKRYYVIWVGKKTGIYNDWDICRKYVDGFPNAKYKGFSSYTAAEKALEDGWKQHVSIVQFSEKKPQFYSTEKPIEDSISVDAAWNTLTLDMEYQGVHTSTGKLLFREGPFAHGTNNVGEFLAIVHGLGYCKKHNLNLSIYSDSRNAIAWVKNKHHRSNLVPTEKNKKIFALLDRAEKWLGNNSYENKILKWETGIWGENPADFGRK